MPVEARLFRDYSSLPEALKAIPVLTPRKSANGKLHRSLLISLVRSLLQALGPWQDDYSAARRALSRWTKSAERSSRHPDERLFAREADTLIPRLITLYEEPRRFFDEIAPEIYALDFSEVAPEIHGFALAIASPARMRRTNLQLSRSPHLTLSRLRAAEWLGRILKTWGCAALFNRSVRRAFDSAPADVVLEALAIAEGRRTHHSRGPRKGTTKGKPKKPRVNHEERAAIFLAAANRLAGLHREEDREILQKSLLIPVLRLLKKNGKPFTPRIANGLARGLTAQYFHVSKSAIDKSVKRARKR
jgi:hypothetical protein